MGRALMLLALFVAVTMVKTPASDVGPAKDVAAVKYDAQRLLAHKATEAHVAVVELPDVVVMDDWAMVRWTAGATNGTVALRRFRGQWWDAAEFTADRSAHALRVADCTPALADCLPLHSSSAVGSGDIQLLAPSLPADLLRTAVANSAAVRDFFGPEASRPHVYGTTTFRTLRTATGRTPRANSIALVQHEPRAVTAGFDAVVSFSKSAAAGSASFDTYYFRLPTESESLGPNADSLCYFHFIVAAPSPLQLAQGNTIDVWFPFVLQPNMRYSVSFSTSTANFTNIPATLKDNVLHVTLPAFALGTHDDIQGEFDGDPTH